MTRALRKLQSVYDSPLGEDAALSSGAVQTLKISSKRGRMFALFSTHPPLEERIARLEQMTSV
jgi:Zn-dependent protease with chaperone function